MTSTFKNALNTFDTIVENGPLGTRLKFEYKIESILEVIDQPHGKAALNEIYEGDIAVAQKNGLPIIINAATYRASRNHLIKNDNISSNAIKHINQSCLKLIIDAQNRYS